MLITSLVTLLCCVKSLALSDSNCLFYSIGSFKNESIEFLTELFTDQVMLHSSELQIKVMEETLRLDFWLPTDDRIYLMQPIFAFHVFVEQTIKHPDCVVVIISHLNDLFNDYYKNAKPNPNLPTYQLSVCSITYSTGCSRANGQHNFEIPCS